MIEALDGTRKFKKYNPTIHYINGHTNLEADAQSRLPMDTTEVGIEVMLKPPSMDPQNSLLNRCIFDLEWISLHQQTDRALKRL